MAVHHIHVYLIGARFDHLKDLLTEAAKIRG
jgi:hypothetical protein